MKKIFYNVVTKLVAMLCVLVTVGIILNEIIGIFYDDAQKEYEYEKIYNDYMDVDDIYSDVYMKIGEYLDILIAAHKEGGMQAFADRYYSSADMLDDMLIVAVDSKNLYKYGLELFEATHGDYKYVELYFENTSEGGNCRNMVITDMIEEAYYDGEIRTWGLDRYLSTESVRYLQSIDYELTINVRVRDILFEEIEQSHYKSFSNHIKSIETTIEDSAFKKSSLFITAGAMMLVATVILGVICGRQPEGKKELNYYERGYTEIHIAIIALCGTALFIGIAYFFVRYYDLTKGLNQGYIDALHCSFMAIALVGVFWLYYELGIIIKKIINKRFLKDSFIIRVLLRIKCYIVKCKKRFLAWFKNIYNKESYMIGSKLNSNYIIKVIVDIFMVIATVFVLFLLLEFDSYIAIFMGMFMVIFVLIYIAKTVNEYFSLARYSRIRNAVGVIAEGNYRGVEIRENESDETIKKLANMSDSFEESVRKQVEAEKKQIELVANVSHDLKTPLTSIISYVDLLKEEEMTPVARDYVKALVNKSAKLKDIVADVFDLAKATSGEQVELEQLDGVVLVNQVLSDMSDRIEASERDFRLKLTAETAPIIGNGQKLYRVFQNIIDNALRYSMIGTRIYLNVELLNDEFVISLKNISANEMNFTAEEILSRANIDEESEKSEGNGLGLSIAKSFTQLCGGTFDVLVDDDVFKVIIRFRQVYIEQRGGSEVYEENNI